MTRFHLIGNAHLDPVWLWRWQEGYAEILATFRSALDRIRDNPDFVFTCACAGYYEWVEQNDPAMFAEIKEAVQKGQWCLTGGMWIQPDMNAPSGESIARQLLYSQRYFESRFGRKAVTAYNVDTFGHNGMLPQFFRKAGLTAYVWMRPQIQENREIPEGPMIWESPDGSSVLAYRIHNEYTRFDHITEKILLHDEFSRKVGFPVMVFYGVGNHGGGPTVQNLKEIDKFLAASPLGSETAYSSPDRYFEELRTALSLPIWKSELQHHASGCYSTCSRAKRLHRKAELALTSLEKFGVLAAALSPSLPGAPLLTPDRSLLLTNWKTLLFNEFHDVMGGCSLPEAMEDAAMQLTEVISSAAREENRLLQRLAWSVNTMAGATEVTDGSYRYIDGSAKGAPFIVFNPHPFAVTEPIRLSHHYRAAETEDGTPVPIQLIRGTRTNGQSRFDTLVQVTVPPLGYTTVWLTPDTEDHPEAPVYPREPILENEYLRAEFDPVTGSLIHLIDKATGTDSLTGPCGAELEDIAEADTWAHMIFRFDKTCGEFTPIDWKIREDGPVCWVLQLRGEHRSEEGVSRLEQRFILYQGSRQLDMEVTLDLCEHHKMVKLTFPTPWKGGEISEIPYGMMSRTACGNEEHCHRLVALEGCGRGLALLNDGKYSYSCQDGVLKLTAANTSLYADHYGQAYRDDTGRFMDQGRQTFRCALRPYRGSWQEADLFTAAEVLNDPLRWVQATYHEGTLPSSLTGLSLENQTATVELGAAKLAEDGDGLILRLVERSGRAGTAAVTLPAALDCHLTLSFTPFEIKTVRIPFDASRPVCETDLLEE